MTVRLVRTLAALCLPGALALAATAPDLPLVNAGFEDGWPAVTATADSSDPRAKVSGTVAAGWADNSSWADVQVAYGADHGAAHAGGSAQRITIARVASGAVQYVQNVSYVKGHAYAFSLWLRGRSGATATLLLRKGGAPYTQYAAADVTLAAEWRRYTVEGVVPEDVADGMIMLRLTAPQEVLVDDAQLSDLSAVASDAPPQTGNLLSGGSFEAGMPFGWSTRISGPPRWEFRDPRPVVAEGPAVDGTRAYRIDLPAGTDACLQSPLIHPLPQRVHSASLWVRASRPDTWVRVELEKTAIAGDFRVGREWQRVAISGQLPFLRWTRLRVRTHAPDDQPDDPSALSLWVDGVQVEEAAQTAEHYRPRMPHEFTMTLGRPGSIVFDGEQANVSLGFASPPPAGARLLLRVAGVFGQEIELPAVALPAATIALPAMAERPRGTFKLTARMVDAAGAALAEPVDLVWSRLPRPRELPAASSYFGTHIPLSPDFIAIARASGTRWVRLHDASMLTKWPICEPAAGRWEFFDPAIDAAHLGGLAVLGMLDGAPRRVSSTAREGGYWGIWHLPDLPEAPAAWETYVRTVVGHYRGRVAAWEMWNEPWGEWWTGAGGTPEQYAKLMTVAYRAAKQEDPAATFIGVDTYRGRDAWHDGVLAAGGLASFDAFSFHDYADSLYGGAGDQAQLETAAFTAAQARHGTPKPLWNTEGGVMDPGSFYAPETGGMPVRRQLAQAIRYDVAMLAAGVKVFCLYAMHSDPAMGENECRATESDRAIKPLVAARAVLAALVDGGGVPLHSTQPGLDLYTWPARDGQRVAVAWSGDGEPHRLALPDGARALDAVGNPFAAERDGAAAGQGVMVDGEPVYLLTPVP